MKAQRDLSLSLIATADMDSALKLIMHTAVQISGMDSASILVFDDMENQFNVHAATGLSKDFINGISTLAPDSPLGEIFSSGLLHYINIKKDEKFRSQLPNECGSEGLEAFAIIPILHNNKVIATLNVSSHSSAEIPVNVRSYIETIASQMAGTIARLKAEESLKESEFEKTILNRIADVFLTTTGDEMYSKVLDIVRDALSSRFGIFGYINEDSDFVCPSMTRDIFDECNIPDKNIVFKQEKWGGIWGDSLKQKKTLVNNSPLPVPNGHIMIEKVLCVPVIHDELLIGNLVIANKESDYSEKDIKLLESIADYVAPVLHSHLKNERYEKERKKAEAELKKVSYAVSHSPSLIVITGPEGNIEYINPAFSRTTGYALDEVIGKNPRFLKSGYMPDIEYEQLWKTISAGLEWRGEFQNKKKNGDLYWEFGSILPVTNDQGEIIHYIGIKEDVTEKKDIDEEMNRLMNDMEVLVRQVEDKNSELEAFTYSVSHDLKSPLVTIDGFARVIEEEYGDAIGEEGVRYLHKIIRSSRKMKALINDLLDYSRIGRFVDEKEEISFRDIVSDAMDMLRHISDERGIKINIEDKDTVLLGEKSRMVQVFQNLISNSIKYIGEDNPDPVIEIGFREIEGETAFFVSDNGMGMDLSGDNKQRIFNMFQRLTTYMSQESSGVGLAIVKRIVESHNGRVWVESEPGKGSTFYFTNS